MDSHVQEQIDDIVAQAPQKLSIGYDLTTLVELAGLPHTREPVLRALDKIAKECMYVGDDILGAKVQILNSGRAPTNRHVNDILDIAEGLKSMAINGIAGQPYGAVVDQAIEAFNDIENYHGRNPEVHAKLCKVYESLYDADIINMPEKHFTHGWKSKPA